MQTPKPKPVVVDLMLELQLNAAAVEEVVGVDIELLEPKPNVDKRSSPTDVVGVCVEVGVSHKKKKYTSLINFIPVLFLHVKIQLFQRHFWCFFFSF